MAPVSFSDLPPEALDDIARRAGPLNNVGVPAASHHFVRQQEGGQGPRPDGRVHVPEGGAGSGPPAGHLRRDADPRRRERPVVPFRPGAAKSWTALRFPKWMQHKYVDVVYHKGAFYTASREAAVTAWVPDTSSSGLHATRVTELRPVCAWAALVESLGGGDLLMVNSSGMEDHAQYSYLRGIRRYEVSRYEEREGTWLPVEDLGEVAILVGIGGRSLCVSKRGGRDALRNRLYFARPYVSGENVSGEYYDGHPREYRLPTATAGYGYIYVPHCSSSWVLPYVAPEFHRN
uniref:KIB1-4 beta-propeller domain-containing protein n=1 Tax=Oryza punctata TaxID=4537 RepID=A0A0E0JTH3_ORYPU